MKINKMNYGVWIVLILLTTACSSDDDGDNFVGNWVDRSVFDGTPRSSAVSYTIGNKGYMGTGYDGDDYLDDFWVYDMDGNFWTQLASFPGLARSSAVAFTVDGNGYIGLGFDGDDELADFYRYNTSGNSWVQIADFEGSARRGALAFDSAASGYVGTGFDGDNDKKDFWKYNPATDSWSEVLGFGGNKRRDAASFTIGGDAYIGTGVSNGINLDDFWKFNTTTETWTQLNDIDEDDDDGVFRSAAVGFSLGGFGYIATGSTIGPSDAVWEYNPGAESWEQKTDYEGLPRQDAVAFYNDSRAFVLLGRNGSLFLDDNREFFAFEDEDEDD